MIAALGAGAQQPMDMEACMRYAVEHAADVAKKEYAVKNARADVHTALAAFFPRVTADVNAQYAWGRNVDPETNTYNTVNTFNNYYQLSASVGLFDGGQTINQFRQALLLLRQGRNEWQLAADNRAVETMQKYVEAAYAQACILLAEEKLADSRQLLVKTQRMEGLGLKGRPDVVQIEAQVAEDDYELTRRRNQLQAALLALKAAMNYPQGDSLVLVVPDEAGGKARPVGGGTIAEGHPRALSAQMAVRNASYEYRIAKGRLYPRLSLSAGVTTNYYKNLSAGTTSASFKAQWDNNMGEYVYATFSIPVFDLSRWKSARKARNNVSMARLDCDEAMRRLHDEAGQALLDCRGYEKEQVKMACKTANDSVAYHFAKRKYEEGMLSVFDLHTASQALLQSRVARLQIRLMLAVKRRLLAYYQDGTLGLVPSSENNEDNGYKD